MDADELVRAIRAALDAGAQIDPAALREIVDAYERTENDWEDRVRLGDWESCSDMCAGDLLELIVRALARGLGINPEEETAR